MIVNKVIDKTGNVLLDLTGDTIAPEDVAQGKTFHDKSGVTQVGTAVAGTNTKKSIVSLAAKASVSADLFGVKYKHCFAMPVDSDGVPIFGEYSLPSGEKITDGVLKVPYVKVMLKNGLYSAYLYYSWWTGVEPREFGAIGSGADFSQYGYIKKATTVLATEGGKGLMRAVLFYNLLTD